MKIPRCLPDVTRRLGLQLGENLWRQLAFKFFVEGRSQRICVTPLDPDPDAGLGD